MFYQMEKNRKIQLIFKDISFHSHRDWIKLRNLKTNLTNFVGCFVIIISKLIVPLRDDYVKEWRVHVNNTTNTRLGFRGRARQLPS